MAKANQGVGTVSLPAAVDMRASFLKAIKSGRQKSLDSVKGEIAADLGVKELRQEKGWTNELEGQFYSRFLSAYASLYEDGFVAMPKSGKVQLTDLGKKSVKEILQAEEDAPGTQQDMSESPIKQMSTVQPSASNVSQKTSDATTGESASISKSLASFLSLPGKAAPPSSTEGKPTAPANRVQSLNGKAKAVAAVICLVLSFWGGSATGGAAAESRAISEATALAEQQHLEEVAAAEAIASNSELSVLVRDENPSTAKKQVAILVTGETDAGKKVNARYLVTPNKNFTLDYPAGEYLVQLDVDSAENGDNVYEAAAMKAGFSDTKDMTIDLDLVLDKDATAAKQAAREEAERQKAEEEARKKAEAERAKAEAEAKELAEQQEREAAAANAPTSRTVYITATGEKYHKNGCRYLKDSQIAISLDDAIAQGYTACKVCGG